MLPRPVWKWLAGREDLSDVAEKESRRVASRVHKLCDRIEDEVERLECEMRERDRGHD